MTRRSWLAAISAFAALPGVLLTAMRRSETTLPWPTYRVGGARALEKWERLRAAGNGYPLIVGGRENLERLAEQRTSDDRDPESILAAAASYRFPEDLTARRKSEEAEARAWIAEHPDRNHVIDIVIDADGSIRSETADERQALEPDSDVPPLGEWPTIATANSQIAIVTDPRTGGRLDEVYIVVLPVADFTEAPALLRYGGWNDCPAPEAHVAALRRWRADYGFELICVGADIMEGRVRRRPSDRAAAIQLSREQAVYCPDVIDQGAETLSNLAATLMAGDWWFFWWD